MLIFISVYVNIAIGLGKNWRRKHRKNFSHIVFNHKAALTVKWGESTSFSPKALSFRPTDCRCDMHVRCLFCPACFIYIFRFHVCITFAAIRSMKREKLSTWVTYSICTYQGKCKRLSWLIQGYVPASLLLPPISVPQNTVLKRHSYLKHAIPHTFL